MIGAVAILKRRWGKESDEPVLGSEPVIPVAEPQRIPTLKMPTAYGWKDGNLPVAADGLKVDKFAADLDHPRWIHVLPNNDVLVAEAMEDPKKVRSAFDYAMVSTMKRAAAVGKSADRITLFRDSNGDGTFSMREVFLQNQNKPFGMAMLNNTFYVGNTDGLMSFLYVEGATSLTGEGHKLVDFKPGGHWTRSLLASQDGTKIYAGVGSNTNIADNGMEEEEGRAAIHEFDIQTGQSRIFATGLRNAVGMAWEPNTNVLWTVVNERDGLGDEVPPDYLTSVQEGGFYGWPYCYWHQTVDERVPQDPAMVAKAIVPDYALGGAHCFIGPVLDASWHLAWLRLGWHGYWSAWFMESKQSEWLQSCFCAV